MKTEVMSIPEFMNGKVEAPKKFHPESLVPLATAPLWSATPAFAANADLYGKMVGAFDPLVSLIQALAYPVAMVVVLGGALFVMIGNKEKGFTMMQSAGLGYVLVQMTPMVLDILVQAMKAAV